MLEFIFMFGVFWWNHREAYVGHWNKQGTMKETNPDWMAAVVHWEDFSKQSKGRFDIQLTSSATVAYSAPTRMQLLSFFPFLFKPHPLFQFSNAVQIIANELHFNLKMTGQAPERLASDFPQRSGSRTPRTWIVRVQLHCRASLAWNHMNLHLLQPLYKYPLFQSFEHDEENANPFWSCLLIDSSVQHKVVCTEIKTAATICAAGRSCRQFMPAKCVLNRSPTCMRDAMPNSHILHVHPWNGGKNSREDQRHSLKERKYSRNSMGRRVSMPRWQLLDSVWRICLQQGLTRGKSRDCWSTSYVKRTENSQRYQYLDADRCAAFNPQWRLNCILGKWSSPYDLPAQLWVRSYGFWATLPGWYFWYISPNITTMIRKYFFGK